MIPSLRRRSEVAPTIAIVGLGYVGLPLVIEFGKLGRVIGFDINELKVQSCIAGKDPSKELSDQQMQDAIFAEYSSDPVALRDADYVIIAVPTPVTPAHTPDFGALIGASKLAGANMKRNATIIYESTVYPGATEEVCIPVLEESSGLKWKQDFFVGYSPERINPGDQEHSLTNVVKVVSGDTTETLDNVGRLYEQIVKPGVHYASSIKVAEASKVIENTQRDLNIALMNELAIIFDRIGIDTLEVLEAAGTKWNFLPFRPGLVGGHCIGVDPYYLTHKAETLGYHPQVILAGRRINDGMGKYIAEQTIKQMILQDKLVKDSTVTILGLTFKENCSDIRNSKVVDIVNELSTYGVQVQVHDPLVHAEDAWEEYKIKLYSLEELAKPANALILAVPHREFLEIPELELLALVNGPVLDVKSAFTISAWRL